MKTDRDHERKREKFNELCEVGAIRCREKTGKKKITTKEIEKMLGSDFDTVSKRNGIFTIRKGYFYTYGKSEQDLVNTIELKIPFVKVIDSGNYCAPFKGGASIANQSHWWVRFTI